jgi:hypothetical protein
MQSRNIYNKYKFITQDVLLTEQLKLYFFQRFQLRQRDAVTCLLSHRQVPPQQDPRRD